MNKWLTLQNLHSKLHFFIKIFANINKNYYLCRVLIRIVHFFFIRMSNTSTAHSTPSNAFPHFIHKQGMGDSIRRFYYDYRAVIFFGLTISALVVLSYWLSLYISVSFYEQEIVPMAHAASIIVCIWGGANLLKHNDGIRVRKLTAYVFLFWAFVETLLLIFNFTTNSTILKPGTERIDSQGLLIANIWAFLVLIYPTEALRPGWLNFKRAFLLFVPVIILAVLYYAFSIDLRVLMALYPVFIFVMLLSNVGAYRRWCEENFSSLDNIDVQPIMQYLVLALITGISYYYLCYSTHPVRGFTQLWLLLYLVMFTTDQVLFRRDPWKMVKESDFARQIDAQATGYDPQAEEMNPDSQTQEEPHPSAFAEYKLTLDHYMANEKPYLNKDLRLSDLMRILPLNRTYLSQLINSEYGCTFYQFITSYRLQEAMRLMSAYPDMKLQEVADRSGFSSPTVFSRVFVREIGATPTEWSEQQNQRQS